MSSLSAKGSVHDFSHLKVLITLEEVNTSVVEKKKNLIFMSKTLMGRQTSLVL